MAPLRSRGWKIGLAFVLVALDGLALGQQIGNWVKEVHPPLTTWECTKELGCKALNTTVVLDEKFRWLHVDGSTMSCKNNSMLVNETYCFDQENCHQNCVYEGANYTAAGVATANAGGEGSSITMNLFSPKQVQLTPRVYLFDEDKQEYVKLVIRPNMEFTFDVDMSAVSCTAVGSLYLVEMAADGGKNQYNNGGASMGCGYCDAQCRVRDFINGVLNLNGSGACCAEHDIWESSRVRTSSSTHPCIKYQGPFACTGNECHHILDGDGGLCSHYSCGVGGNGIYGKNKRVNTLKPFTVISRFLPVSKTNNQLGSIDRIYIQNGKKTTTDIDGARLVYNNAVCADTGVKLAGGMAAVGKYLERGTVITFSLNVRGIIPGMQCGQDGTNAEVEKYALKAKVTFSNIRWGEIGSTYDAQGGFPKIS